MQIHRYIKSMNLHINAIYEMKNCITFPILLQLGNPYIYSIVLYSIKLINQVACAFKCYEKEFITADGHFIC